MAKDPGHPQNLRFAVLAADIALFAIREGELLVRLIMVHRPPFYDLVPGLPGGLLSPDETAEEAAARHLSSRSNIDAKHAYLEQLATFSELDRDLRGRVVAVAYLACVPWESLSAKEREDTEEAWWCPASELPPLAYDHGEIMHVAVKRLRSRISYTTLISKLMPKEFTLTELEQAYECILGTDLDKRNFRKKLLKLEVLSPLGKKRQKGRSRPAELYRFTSQDIKEIEVL